MTSGGPRPGSGTRPDPRSASSERRAVTMLPADGYDGEIPPFPIPGAPPRAVELWSWAWRTPQAAAWAREVWRQHDVARWCLAANDYEKPNPPAAVRSDVNALADRVGLSEAGLRYNGWTVGSSESPRAERAAMSTATRRTSSRARMTILSDEARPA